MKKEKTTIYIVRATLILLTILTFAFVIRNGVASGEVSAQQSHAVTETVQEVVGTIDPESPIATATGAEFDLLHACVREFAHFFEYFLLAAFSFGSFLSFAEKGKWRFAFLPPCFVGATIALDECLQSAVDGRAGQLLDAMVDAVGACCGTLLALLVFFAVRWIVFRLGDMRSKEAV